MQIALFGGSFDPIHLGHQLVVEQVLKHHLFDEVWYVPVGNHDFGKQMTPAVHRLAMLELILIPGTKIETFEIDSPLVSYTHATLDGLQARYPGNTFSWILGSDQLASLDQWGCGQEAACFPALLSTYSFYVYPRAGYALNSPYPALKPLSQVPEIEISSTEIRRRRANGEPITGLVDPSVEKYIEKNGLYLRKK